ncbi:translocation/assembly module TamB, partial [bacterium]|nr:translocation/assembly module TamB [bacterium]
HFVGSRESVALVRGDVDAWARILKTPGIFEELRDVTASASIADGVLMEGDISAMVDGQAVRLTSRRSVHVEGSLLKPLILGGVDLGVLAFSTDPHGVGMNIPGLMEQGEIGRAVVRGKGDVSTLLVAGPAEHPLMWGEVEFSDMSFTYPFLSGSDSGLSGDFFSRLEWSLTITAGRNLWYRRADADLKLDRGTELSFAGIPEDHTFCVSGRASSSRGTITYLNTDFTVHRTFIDFPAFCEPPRFYVEGTTRVEDGTEITLSVVSEEQAGAAFAATGTLWDESTVLLRSDSPDDVSGEDVLARLTYGSGRESLEGDEIATLERRRAIEVVASQIGVAVFRPLLSPVEGRMKRALGLDLVRIDVDFIEHFLYQLDQWRAQEGSGQYQPFLADSRLTLGKYIAHDWLLSYEGMAEAYEVSVGQQSLGAQHELGIEYEVSRNTSLSLKAVYDPTLAGWDRRVSIENHFWF